MVCSLLLGFYHIFVYRLSNESSDAITNESFDPPVWPPPNIWRPWSVYRYDMTYILLLMHRICPAGGLSDLSRMPPGSTAGLPVSFTGCIRRLSIDYETIPLNYSSIAAARNIADCDGTPCGGDLCHHGGSCWLDMDMKPHCHCLQVRYTIHSPLNLSGGFFFAGDDDRPLPEWLLTCNSVTLLNVHSSQFFYSFTTLYTLGEGGLTFWIVPPPLWSLVETATGLPSQRTVSNFYPFSLILPTQEFTGDSCNKQVPCTEFKCQNKGHCVSDNGNTSFVCKCPPGWDGPFCTKGR